MLWKNCHNECSQVDVYNLLKQLLDSIGAEVTSCQKCELWETRKHSVPGEGDAKHRIILIGEAPGHWEDLQGKPFVGAAGKILDKLLFKAALPRQSVFITNVLKCKPPKNRDPTQREIKKCTPYLDRQIQAIKPRLIVTLGTHSTAYMFHKAGLDFDNITGIHGRQYKYNVQGVETSIFPTFHPAAALYSGKYKKLLELDFQLLKQSLQG